MSIAFGEHDPCLNAGVAAHLGTLFPKTTVRTVSGAAHWPQWDQPAATATVIREI